MIQRMRIHVAITMLVTACVAQAQTVIRIDDTSSLGTIQPEVYGQFVEHLGAQIYGGIWVGEDSRIPNTAGLRNDVLAALQALDIPVMRWPGGCFADIYHWRDGIGPRDRRTPRVNMPWGGTSESNQFGTHEFFDLAERLGAKTYLNVNLGTGSVREAADWLEYITSDSDSALARERRANGRTEPWKVDYLSVGNETWGCGGHMRPDVYADLYAQWATFLKTAGPQPVRIISGSHDGNKDYSDSVLDHPNIGQLAEGISLHYYTLPTGDWSDKGDATGFDATAWARTLQRTLRMDALIREQLDMIDSHPAIAGDFGLFIDEWGMWVNTPDGAPALFQQNTIRDAVVAALNFNIFHTYAGRVPMTNIAQMVNVLQAMILVDGPDIALTPTYHVFEMYRPFQGAESLAVHIDSPVYVEGDIRLPALSVSAARREDGRLVVALVNADAVAEHAVRLSLPGARGVTGRLLAGATLDAHNTFDQPQRVRPAAQALSVEAGHVDATLPPRSVAVWIVEQ